MQGVVNSPRSEDRLREYRERQKTQFENFQVYRNISDPSEVVIIDGVSSARRPEVLEAIELILGKDGYREWSKRIVDLRFCFNPQKPRVFEEDGQMVFNRYDPPEYRRENFCHGTAVPKETEIPSCYKKLLWHLVGGKEESYQYVLFWLAANQRGKVPVALTLVGPKGTGKTLLGDLGMLLNGLRNSYMAGNDVLKSPYNDYLLDKTLVVIDEFNFKAPDVERRFKALTNNYIDLNVKYQNRIQVENFASILLTSNEYDALKISSDERRYSVLYVTNTPLRELVSDVAAFVKELKAPENIKRFGQFLYHLSVTRNMNVPFLDKEVCEKIAEAGRPDWVNWLLDAPKSLRDKPFDLAGMQTEIQRANPAVKTGPSRSRLDEVFEAHKDQLSVKKKGSGRVYTVLRGAELSLGDTSIREASTPTALDLNAIAESFILAYKNGHINSKHVVPFVDHYQNYNLRGLRRVLDAHSVVQKSEGLQETVSKFDWEYRLRRRDLYLTKIPEVLSEDLGRDAIKNLIGDCWRAIFERSAPHYSKAQLFSRAFLNTRQVENLDDQEARLYLKGLHDIYLSIPKTASADSTKQSPSLDQSSTRGRGL